MTSILVQLKDCEKTECDWNQTFDKWQQTGKKSSLDFLRTLRNRGYELKFNSLRMSCWMPTILNQIVSLNGTTYLHNPRIKCFDVETDGDKITFDIILQKTPPYIIQRIDIDIIEELGNQETGVQQLTDIMELCNVVGCPLRITDHAQVGTLVPCSLISIMNNTRARTYPQKMGFKGSANIKKDTRDRIAFWRFQHQNQLMHFINCEGKVNKERLPELCAFFQDKLPRDLQDCILKMTLREYIRSPPEIKNTTLNDLMK